MLKSHAMFIISTFIKYVLKFSPGLLIKLLTAEEKSCYQVLRAAGTERI